MLRIVLTLAGLAALATGQTAPALGGIAELEALLDQAIAESDVPRWRQLETAAVERARQCRIRLLQAEQLWAETAVLAPAEAGEAAYRLDAAALAETLAQIELRRLTVRRLQAEAIPESARIGLQQARTKLREHAEFVRLRNRTQQDAASLKVQTEYVRALTERANRIDLPPDPIRHTLAGPRPTVANAAPPAPSHPRPPSPVE